MPRTLSFPNLGIIIVSSWGISLPHPDLACLPLLLLSIRSSFFTLFSFPYSYFVHILLLYSLVTSSLASHPARLCYTLWCSQAQCVQVVTVMRPFSSIAA